MVVMHQKRLLRELVDALFLEVQGQAEWGFGKPVLQFYKILIYSVSERY